MKDVMVLEHMQKRLTGVGHEIKGFGYKIKLEEVVLFALEW